MRTSALESSLTLSPLDTVLSPAPRDSGNDGTFAQYLKPVEKPRTTPERSSERPAESQPAESREPVPRQDEGSSASSNQQPADDNVAQTTTPPEPTPLEPTDKAAESQDTQIEDAESTEQVEEPKDGLEAVANAVVADVAPLPKLDATAL